MATEAEALLLRIEASATKLERDMARANQIFDRQARSMERRALSLSTSVGAAVSRLAAQFAAGATAFVGVSQIEEASQAYIRAENSLKVAGKSGDDLTQTFKRLYDVAQDNSTPIETLVALYSKASQAQTSLKASEDQLMAFTSATAQALRVQGKSAEESSGALLQLGQVISGSSVQAEEYNSLIDGAYPLLQAAAAGLKEAGGEVSKLTALVKDGKVSSAAFFNAVIAGAPVLGQKLAGAQKTVAQAGIEFSNAMIGLVGAIDKAVGATPRVAGALSAGSKQIETVTGFVNDLAAAHERLAKAMNNVPGYTAYGTAPNGVQGGAGSSWYDRGYGSATPATTGIGAGAELAAIQKRLNEDADRKARETAAELAREAARGKALANMTAATPAVKPVSLEQFPVAAGSKGSGGGDSESDYDREIRSIQERTAALQAEISVVGLSTEAQLKATEVQRLKTAADREGLALTPQRLAEIDRVSSAYAAQTVALERVTDVQQQLQERQMYFAETATDAFADLVLEGQSLDDTMRSVAKSLARAAIQAALLGSGPLAGMFGTTAATSGSVGGVIGSLFKAIGFDGGGWTGQGDPGAVAGVVHGQEYVVRSGQAKKYLPLLEAINRGAPGFADGGFVGSRPSLMLPSLSGGASRRSSRSERPVSVNMTVQAADAPSFRRSQSQITSEMTRAVRRGQRGL